MISVHATDSVQAQYWRMEANLELRRMEANLELRSLGASYTDERQRPLPIDAQ